MASASDGSRPLDPLNLGPGRADTPIVPPRACNDPPEGPPRLICHCVRVSSVRIAAAARGEGSTDLESIQTATGAGTGCGSCHVEIEEILDSLRGDPFDPARRAVSYRSAAGRTRSRIETSLDFEVTWALPPGASVELLNVEGLRVELRLTPKDDPGLRAEVAARLVALVCGDLEVSFA
jgi:bacterioferritin-associated ferredoxin